MSGKPLGNVKSFESKTFTVSFKRKINTNNQINYFELQVHILADIFVWKTKENDASNQNSEF